MCPHTTVYVSSTTLCVSSHYYTCPHTTVYVSSFYDIYLDHTYIYIYIYDARWCTAGAAWWWCWTAPRLRLLWGPSFAGILLCVLILLYVCSHTTIHVVSAHRLEGALLAHLRSINLLPEAALTAHAYSSCARRWCSGTVFFPFFPFFPFPPDDCRRQATARALATLHK